MKMTLALLGLSVLAVIAFLAWAASPWSLKGQVLHPSVVQFNDIVTQDEENPAVIKVLTWNLGFLFGEGSEGPNYEAKDRSFFDEKLSTIVTEIKSWEPDVVLLQEIDFHSHRSHFMNQAQVLARKASYPYVAEAPSWVANYIPFPYWPTSRHFGAMKSGGAILSKYPITQHEVVLLSKPQSQPWWYNLFYLHRYFQKVTIDFGEDKKLSFVNLHLEAFDKVDRAAQVRDLLKRYPDADILGGDFNMVPDVATKKRAFKNEDDYENDLSFGVLKNSTFAEVIPEDIYALDEPRYFTYPASKPDRRLDYIFFKQGLKMMKSEVLNSKVSDHLPLRAIFQIRAPKVNPYSL